MLFVKCEAFNDTHIKYCQIVLGYFGMVSFYILETFKLHYVIFK